MINKVATQYASLKDKVITWKLFKTAKQLRTIKYVYMYQLIDA